MISQVNDQLTGEYKCQEVNSTRSKGPRRNSFKLFVPSTFNNDLCGSLRILFPF